MWNQLLIVLVAGLVETALYTAYLIKLGNKEKVQSSFLMALYIFVYLWLLTYVLKEPNNIILIGTYAIACALGNYIAMKIDDEYRKARKWWKKYSRRLWKK